MLPTLKNNDYIIVTTLIGKLSIGTIIICKHDKFGIITKRIYQLLENDYFLLTGDNKEQSSSTEKIGKIHKSQIVGKYLLTIKAPQKRSSIQ